MSISIGDVQRAFFAAMQAGYAIGGPKITIPGLPGYKVIPWEEGDWRVIDAYAVGARGSAGFTTIFHREFHREIAGELWDPVWVMHYGGWYTDEAIPFLKRALLTAYEKNEFVGGRGPVCYTEVPYVYINAVGSNDPRNSHNAFSGFQGKEQVFGLSYILGQHDYSGMMLVPYSE